MPKQRALSETDLRLVAAEAQVDARTLRKFLRGESIRGAFTVERMRRALAARGVSTPAAS